MRPLVLLVIFHLLGTRVLFWAQPSLRLIGPLDSSSGNDLNFKYHFGSSSENTRQGRNIDKDCGGDSEDGDGIEFDAFNDDQYVQFTWTR